MRRKHLGFRKLAARIKREYVKKGYSEERAAEIGWGTAADVYRNQMAHAKRVARKVAKRRR